MSRRFSMTSNPIPAVRASESQDEAKPLLGDAEEKCDVVVEAIGFGNWSLLLVILHRHPVDGAHARVYRGPVRRLRERIRRRERKQHTFCDDGADHNGGAERAGDVDAARDDGGETQLILMFAVRIVPQPSPRRAPASAQAGAVPLKRAVVGPGGNSAAL